MRRVPIAPAWLAIALTVAAVGLSQPGTASADDLVIAGIPEEPFRFKTEAGEVKGIDVDIVDCLFKRLGLTYRVALVDSPARLEKTWKTTGDYDMVFTYSYREWRTEHLIYPKESHLTTSYHFFILKENEGRFTFDTLEDLKGLRVGTTRGFSYTPEFLEAIDSGLFEACEVARNDLHMPKLLRKRIDLVPLPSSVAIYEAQVGGYAGKIAFLPKPLKRTPYFNVFVKRSDLPDLPALVRRYDEELKRMREEGTLETIFRNYGIDQGTK